MESLMSARLATQLKEARRCEDDYRQQHAGDNGKPGFGWLEIGLFSGANEMALPAEVAIARTEAGAASQSRCVFSVERSCCRCV